MKRLIDYLREQMILDFQGDLDVAMLHALLEGEDGPIAQALRAKVTTDRDVNDLMIVLADCLLGSVQQALTDEAFLEQLKTYAGP